MKRVEATLNYLLVTFLLRCFLPLRIKESQSCCVEALSIRRLKTHQQVIFLSTPGRPAVHST
jgi:hypothetical protein